MKGILFEILKGFFRYLGKLIASVIIIVLVAIVVVVIFDYTENVIQFLEMIKEMKI